MVTIRYGHFFSVYQHDEIICEKKKTWHNPYVWMSSGSHLLDSKVQ